MARKCLACDARYEAPARVCPACGSDQAMIVRDPTPTTIDGVASTSAQVPLMALALAAATGGAPGLVLGTILLVAGGLGACLILPFDLARVVRPMAGVVALAYVAFACLSRQWLFTAIPAVHALVVIVMLGSDQSRRSVRGAVVIGWILTGVVLGLSLLALWEKPQGWWTGETLAGVRLRTATESEAEAEEGSWPGP
ncbi:MAG: hypothetical protein H0W72_14680 [Planctomycetes bacterium]|nr:hypothetical protein [Planctomycetota bacterium]